MDTHIFTIITNMCQTTYFEKEVDLFPRHAQCCQETSRKCIVPEIERKRKHTYLINSPTLSSGPVHSYQLDESISSFRVSGVFFIFILFRIDIPVGKQ